MEAGDWQGARRAYEQAIDSRLLLEKQGNPAEANEAYRAAVDSGNPEYAPLAAVGLGLLLQRQGDATSAQAAYQIAIDSRHPDHAPFAMLLIGEHFTADIQRRSYFRGLRRKGI
jgi:tetratricopeptide (TPR) repeat protein